MHFRPGHILARAALITLAVGSLDAASNRAHAEIIPAARRITWDPGVRGDIPVRSTICANVRNSPYNATGNGTSDDTTALQNAISACASGQVVLVPAGTYRITAPIRVKSGVTLRGEGMGRSIIKGASGYGSRWLIGYEDPNYDWSMSNSTSRTLTAGTSKGSTSLTTSAAHGWAAGDYILDQRFVPSLVDISASDYLMAIARRLVEILSAKSTGLASGRRQKNQSLAEFGVADVASFWLLYTINSFFPELRHVYETRRGHPAELYNAMLGLAGALTTFSGVVHPRDLPAYEHENLSGCFTKLDTIVRELLETVVPATTVSLPMKLVQPSIHAAALDQDKYLAAPQIYLAMTVEGRGTDVPVRAPHLIKIAAAGQLDTLIRQALPGVTLTYVPNPPSAVSVKLNHHYFLLQKSGPEWDNIARARNVAAYVPAEFANPQLELLIISPKT